MRPGDWTAIVCGGRGGPPRGVGSDWVFRALDAVDRERRLGHIIQGGQTGIDTLAHYWARDRCRPSTTIWADWDALERMAGPKRNAEMGAFLLRVAPAGLRACLAFPGRDGTESMVSIARAARVPVWRCELVGRSGFAWTQMLAPGDPPV